LNTPGGSILLNKDTVSGNRWLPEKGKTDKFNVSLQTE
jgi:hypothetical protein